MPILYQFITAFGWTNFAAHLVQNSLLDRYTPAPLKAGEIKVFAPLPHKKQGVFVRPERAKSVGICGKPVPLGCHPE